MAYLTEASLRTNSYDRQLETKARRNLRSYRSQSAPSVFLSHSHKDRRLAIGFKNLMGSLGVEVYIDWLDEDMPESPDKETARKLKARIKENILFFVLATKNGMASRWVPWEIGVADQAKSSESVVLVPVADPSGKFHGSEYLQLYSRVELRHGDLELLRPGRSYSGPLLKDYLRASV